MKVRLNGTETELPAGLDVAGLVRRLELRPEQVAVELNEEIVRREAHAGTELHDGDRIEVVTLVGGG